MPLPMSAAAWPPPEQATIFGKYREWQAWWAADLDELRTVYQGQAPAPSVRRDGIVGAVKRFFWGQSATDLRKQQSKLHIPLAGDICQASADLLFGEPITATVEDDAAQERLDIILEDGFHSTAATGAEIGAALGGTFLRVVWDTDFTDHPFIDLVDADYAAPEFRWGRLHAVTFYFQVGATGATVYRHAERHEVLHGIGVVYHGLYQGTATELGTLHPLANHPATAGIKVNGDGYVSSKTPGLSAFYIPNIRPSRRWRKHPIGRHLGRSDLDGIEPLLDALDETYSSWMRDIRLGKARILAGATALDDNGPGNGASFDVDREVYEGLNVPPGAAKDNGLAIEQVQFAIRYQEHQETATELTRNIVRSAGYSAQTFGEGGDRAAATATEVDSRDRRSALTRARKARNWKHGLQTVLTKALAVDAAINRGISGDHDVTVEFPQGAQQTQLQLAQTVQALHSAQSASTRVRVQMMHPDWDEGAIDEEVADVMAEYSLGPSADPDTIGVDGWGLSDTFGADDEAEG